ncbi:hypothetical protein [Bacillus andreraoultii]|uniref:hypothetical protein n=1 Tax=Bacillus andreraoultii TaxID=1499685 RepID=UPI0012B5FF55|nr:hypothetical protein [Bacillus andreraoultii]
MLNVKAVVTIKGDSQSGEYIVPNELEALVSIMRAQGFMLVTGRIFGNYSL